MRMLFIMAGTEWGDSRLMLKMSDDYPLEHLPELALSPFSLSVPTVLTVT